MWGGFRVGELFAAGITTLDIVVIYVFLQVKGRRLALVLWTTLFNIVLPFLGFLTGEFSTYLFSEWSTLLSGILLGLIGLHMLLYDNRERPVSMKIHPAFLAFIVSVDAFSVSVSFGMLHFNRMLFITASGTFAFLFSVVALHFKNYLRIKDGRRLRQFAGVSLVVMGIFSCI